MNQNKSEDAVSPVIGVMLLLVVTIVIAAVVAVFASGVGADAEPMPATAVDVVSVSTGYKTSIIETATPNMQFEDDCWYGDTLIITEEYTDTGAQYSINGEVFAEYIDESGTYSLIGDNTELHEKYFVDIGSTEVSEGTYSPLVTLSSLHGEVLDLSKVSIKVKYYHRIIGEGFIEVPENSLTGTLSPGNTVNIPLSNEMVNHQYPISEKVDVVVYYGSHVITKVENLKVS